MGLSTAGSFRAVLICVFGVFYKYFFKNSGGLIFLVFGGSGESMENALRACCKGIKIGKILIHREGDDGKQVLLSLAC